METRELEQEGRIAFHKMFGVNRTSKTPTRNKDTTMDLNDEKLQTWTTTKGQTGGK